VRGHDVVKVGDVGTIAGRFDIMKMRIVATFVSEKMRVAPSRFIGTTL
jgi:hypothetical protein